MIGDWLKFRFGTFFVNLNSLSLISFSISECFVYILGPVQVYRTFLVMFSDWLKLVLVIPCVLVMHYGIPS